MKKREKAAEFHLRLPPALLLRVKAQAKALQRSVNQTIVLMLQAAPELF